MEFQVAKRSEIKKIVEKAFHKIKSAGYKKLHKRTADDYAGLSRRQVLKCASTNEKIRKISVKFNNKAKPRPVIVKRIHEQQHQVDLVDMKGMCTFHCLAPLERKKNSFGKKELKGIYTLHGIPELIQSDNRGEFKKDAESSCQRKKDKYD